VTVTPKYHFCQRREQLSPCGTARCDIRRAGVSALALATALGELAPCRGFWLGLLDLRGAGITDVGLVALAPAAAAALPALVLLNLNNNPLGDEGLAALVAPPQKAGTPPPPLECWRSSVRSSSATPRSPTLAVTPSPPRLRTVRCRRSTRWGWKASLPSAAAQDALYAAHLQYWCGL
jgi:hypothetical protein